MRLTILDAVISSTMPPATGERIILTARVSPSLVVFTLVGNAVDNFVEHLLDMRPIDQKALADRITREVFGVLFRPETRPLFNLTLYLTERFNLNAFKNAFLTFKVGTLWLKSNSSLRPQGMCRRSPATTSKKVRCKATSR